MRNSRLIVAVGLMAALLGMSHAEEPKEAAAFDPDRKLTAEQLQADFKVFREALEAGHGGLYAHTSRSEMDAVFDAMAKQLEQPATERDLLLGLMSVVKAIRDGHTGVTLSKAYRDWLGTLSIFAPFKLKYIDGRAYTRFNYTADPEERVGEEVLSINDRPMGRITRDMMALLTSDGMSDAGIYTDIEGTRLFSVLHSLLYGTTTQWTYRLRDPKSGKERELTIPGVPTDTLNERYLERHHVERPTTELTWMGKTPVLRMSGMTMSVGNTPMPEYLRGIFEEIAERKATHLIIDFRDNGGGADATGRHLMSHLLDKPFRYYDGLVMRTKQTPYAKYMRNSQDDLTQLIAELKPRPDGRFDMPGHSNLGVHQPVAPHFAGRVTVLVGAQSFSAATETLAVMWAHDRVVMIGSETGGAAVGNTSGFSVNLTLPHSGVELGMPLFRYHQAVGDYPFPHRGFLPDFVMEPTIDELLSDRDPVMEFALKQTPGDG